jgi:hypothetical protein
MEAATERNDSFKATIAKLCNGYGTSVHGPFDVEKGVFIYYEGYFSDPRAICEERLTDTRPVV